MNSKLSSELAVILSIKLVALYAIWLLFFSGSQAAVEPIKTFF